MSRSQQETVRSTHRACALLRLLRESPGETAASLARGSGLDRAVVHRLLRTLEEEGLISSSAGRYQVGGEALLLGQAFADLHRARRAVLPFAMDLHSRVIGDNPWIVSLAIPVRDQVVIAERIWGHKTPLSLLLEVGNRFPIDGVASGRAILATYDAARVEQAIGHDRAGAMRPQLDAIARAGTVATGRGELRPGMNAIAVAVRVPRQPAEAAMVLAGTELELDGEPGSRLVDEMRNAAAAASSSLLREASLVRGRGAA